jgi:hypothetical protein
MPRCSPRQHQPVIISQEEISYQLLETPLSRIEKAYAVTDQITGHQLEYRHFLQRPDLHPIWERAFNNERGRLMQGIRDIAETDIIEFIKAAHVPHGRHITYGRLDIRPQKAEQRRVRLTLGGDRIDYPGETDTKNADLATSKCLWNSTISTDAAMYMCADVKNFYLNTILNRPDS